MEPFTTLRATAMPFIGVNVDTDQILPARFLSKPRSGGFAQYLFHDLRFAGDGSENPAFVLNQPRFRDSRILVGEDNFACGSSRENAVWAICDYGFRAAIAPSFGDIFYNNSLKNGFLPITLPGPVVAAMIRALLDGPATSIGIDLPAQTVTGPDGGVHRFEIAAFPKHCLVNGIDELDYTLTHLAAIDAYEQERGLESDRR
jgi:3-isopropylmalate/(R)-2-methylmalate dehydratase small subunit